MLIIIRMISIRAIYFFKYYLKTERVELFMKKLLFLFISMHSRGMLMLVIRYRYRITFVRKYSEISVL